MKSIPLALTFSLLATAAFADMPAADFVRQASIANQFEIESSELALDRTKDDKVKNLAHHIIDDHEKAGDRMEDALDKSDSNLKPEKDLDDKHEALLDKLKDASDEEFDAQYIAIQDQAHNEAITLFTGYAKSGGDANLQAFATETLPALKEHKTRVDQWKK